MKICEDLFRPTSLTSLLQRGRKRWASGIIRWDGSRLTIRQPELLHERTCGDLRYVGLGHITVPRWLVDP